MAKQPRYRGHPLAYLISIGLFTVVAVGAILLTRGYTIDVRTGSLKKTGLLVVGSHPKDAYITIDGTVQDVRTRSRLTLLPGSYSVTVDLPDTHPWEKRVSIEPGEAVIEEDILLFRDQPENTNLTGGPVGAAALDAPGKRLAYLQSGPDGAGLFVRATDGQDEPRRIALLPPNYAAPTSLTWSNDGNRIAASVAGETRVVPTDGGAGKTVPLGGRTALAPGQTDVLLAETTPGVIVRALEDGSIEPLETDVTSWAVSTNALYAAFGSGDVVRRVRDDRRVVSSPAQAELTAAPDADRVFGRSSDGTVRLFTGSDPEQLFTGAERVVPGRGGEQAVYLRQRELRLWDGQEQTDDLLSRFTVVPAELSVLPGGGYALFGNGSLQAIAVDGSNTTEISAGLTLLGVINLETLLVRNPDGSVSSLEIVSRD